MVHAPTEASSAGSGYRISLRKAARSASGSFPREKEAASTGAAARCGGRADAPRTPLDAPSPPRHLPLAPVPRPAHNWALRTATEAAMGRRDRNNGFNAPFVQLKKLAKPKLVPKPGVQRPAPGAAASRASAPAAAAAPPDDAMLFAAAMRDAAPLGPLTPRVPEIPKAPPPRPTDDDYAVAELTALVSGTAPFRTHVHEEEFYGAAPGVNNALVEGLRRGQYAYQQCLDLHGMVRDEAHERVIKFVSQARCRDGATCVLIVTGRGRSSPDGTSVLRETLPRWLSRAPVRPHVLAYATARPVDGGPGAYYVLLRRQGVRPFGVVA